MEIIEKLYKLKSNTPWLYYFLNLSGSIIISVVVVVIGLMGSSDYYVPVPMLFLTTMILLGTCLSGTEGGLIVIASTSLVIKQALNQTQVSGIGITLLAYFYFFLIYGAVALLRSFLIRSLMKVKESESWYRYLFDLLPQSIAIYNNKENIIFTNDAYSKRVSIYDKQKVIGKNVFELLHKDYHKVFRKDLDNLYNSTNTFQKKIRKYVNIEEKEYLMETYLCKTFFRGEPVIFSVSTDVGYYMKYKEIVEREEKSNEELLDSIPEAIVVYTEGKITYVNNAAIDLFKAKDRNELIGTSYFDRVHPQYLDFVKSEIDTVSKTKELRKYSIYEKLLDLENNEIEVEVRRGMLPYSENYIIVIIKDLTNIREIEKQKEELKESIEDNSIKMEFVANIIRGLQTPINSTFFSLQKIENIFNLPVAEDSKKVFRDNVRFIKQNCYKELKLLSNLSEFARIQTSNFKLVYENIDIIQKVRELTEMSQDFAEYKSIDITFDTTIKSATIAIDEESFERIILNLLANAVKFTPSRGNIMVSIFHSDKEIKVSIADTGIGMSESTLEDIFTRFDQNKPNVGVKDGGGVSLSLVKALVDRLGGKVQAYSEVGKGAEFIVTLKNKTIEEGSEKSNLNLSEKRQRLQQKMNIEFSDIFN